MDVVTMNSIVLGDPAKRQYAGTLIKRMCHQQEICKNMQKHAKTCWGVDVVKAAMHTENAWKVLSKHKDGSIAAAFQVKGKGKVTYSHRQHTCTETR
jgi:hypothetical protein